MPCSIDTNKMKNDVIQIIGIEVIKNDNFEYKNNTNEDRRRKSLLSITDLKAKAKKNHHLKVS